ncbi:MAG: asparagine synthase (glutamine-hydrolyzing) [Pseudolabrys sp.]|nr:asparagine synthase (glutamine-hydrolyzing) [Pseudolabrys sp.]
MCGIAGCLHVDGRPAAAAVLRRMARMLAHRGPDGEGYFTDDAFGLGHRRLAIIDLSAAAAQPMTSADGRYVIAYNGEVYNFRELRGELVARGHRFRTASDTEVVLEALAAWGPKAIERFNGIFAFVLWDRRERRLLLARDRYGVKPLYYAQVGAAFLFASEIKALLAHGALAPALDVEGLAEYLTFQNFFTDRTLFRGVRLLPPGTLMEISAAGAIRTRRYWDFAFADGGEDGERLLERLDEAFLAAVRRQLVSDVAVGAYLSGGMDTGAITAVAARALPGLCSFTIGFDLTSASGLELGFDERRAAERMSYLFGTEHYQMVLKAGDMERAMADLVWHMEEPRVGQSYPNFYASKLASRFVKVVLSGTGGDELFAGYPWRYWRTVRGSGFEDYIDDYYRFWQRLLPDEAHARVLAPVWREVAHVDRRAIFRSVFGHAERALAGPEDYVNHSLYFEAKTFLHGILVVEDKLAMAHGLEARVPFLDNDLVDLACRIPVRRKLANLDGLVRLDENEPGAKPARYYARTRDGKLILRTLMQRYVPDEIANGDKQGFSAPDASWYRGESIDYVRRRLLGASARIYDVLDRGAVEALLREHLEGHANRRLLIWSLLYLEEFMHCFLSAEGRMRELAAA